MRARGANINAGSTLSQRVGLPGDRFPRVPTAPAPPLWLLAELTYRCPLQCPYCSNPLDFAGARFKTELTTEEWCRVFREAKALGVLQLGLSGGEPLLRPDLETLVATARELGLYSSLITSAHRLTKDRLAALKRAGLDHVQISVQAAEAELSDRIAGTLSYRDKLAAYRYTKELGFPLTVNVVLHRANLHQVEALQRFRGESWMPEPCRSCARRAVDFGGCRCQAFLVTGDAGATDPVCSLAPHRPVIDAAVAEVERAAAAGVAPPPLTYRAAPASRALAAQQ